MRIQVDVGGGGGGGGQDWMCFHSVDMPYPSPSLIIRCASVVWTGLVLALAL